MCTNENSARLNNPMKQKKKQQQKTSNTCTLSVYTDLDELRLWSVVFIIHLVGASERGEKIIFSDFFCFRNLETTHRTMYISAPSYFFG